MQPTASQKLIGGDGVDDEDDDDDDTFNLLRKKSRLLYCGESALTVKGYKAG